MRAPSVTVVAVGEVVDGIVWVAVCVPSEAAAAYHRSVVVALAAFLLIAVAEDTDWVVMEVETLDIAVVTDIVVQVDE